MRTSFLLGGLVVLLIVSGCGDEPDEPPAAVAPNAAADGAGAGAPAERGFDAVENLGLAVLRVSTSDLDRAEAVFDEHSDTGGWSASYDYAGGAAAAVVFAPYAEDLGTAAANEAAVRTALESLGAVTEQPYAAVVARFRAASGSPLDRDVLTASDAFDDLAGCDWDGGALMADHVWYCEALLDAHDAATARTAFAGQAGIEPSEVTLTLYR